MNKKKEIYVSSKRDFFIYSLTLFFIGVCVDELFRLLI